MKVAHLTDLHYSRKHKQQALASLDAFIETCRRQDVDIIVSSGDLFDAGIQSSDRDGMPELLDRMHSLLNIAPIYAVEGTPTHDLPGAYSPIEMLNAKYRFHLLGVADHVVTGAVLVMGMPEPSKKWLLSGLDGVGKEEAREWIEDGLRKILLGFGATRDRYPTLPCVFLYHGSIRGATMCNGQTVPQGEITIGRDDLALVGADYYALGHIHLGQQIEGISAYYGGSAYPVNWGETEQKRWNLVRVDGPGDVDIVRIDYPHPPRKKIVTDWGCADDPLGEEIEGYEVWQVYKATKDEAHEINPEEIYRKMLDHGVLAGSRVTVEMIPVETVRAMEIRESKSLRDKLSVWSRSSEIEMGEAVYESAETLEKDAVEAGEMPKAHRWKVTRLILRGAIGTWKNTGLDEVDLNLDEYEPGLIALVGTNGSGKSTIIENLHPYPQMLTRTGKLQDHFRLRDSYRDLQLTDVVTGEAYRALMVVDGQNASGSVEYWLYRNGEPIVNGRKADYEEAIDQLFGPLALYLRSAFVAQKSTKGNPDLSAATQGEKKTLFRTLAGLDYLQAYTLDARERAKSAEEQVQVYDAKLEVAVGIEREKNEARDRVEQVDDEIGECDTLLLASEKAAAKLAERLKDLEPRVEEVREHVRKQESTGEKLDAIHSKREEIQTTIAYYETAAEGADDAAHDVREYETLRQKLEMAQVEYAQAREARNAALAAHYDEAETYRSACRQADDAVAAARRMLEDMEADKRRMVERVDDIEEELRGTIICPECGARFAPDRGEQERKLKEAKQYIFNLDVDIVVARKAFDRCVADRGDLGDAPKCPDMPEPSDAEVRELKGEIAFIDIEAARETIERAKEAGATIRSAQKWDAALEAEARKLAEMAATLEDQIAGGMKVHEEHAAVLGDIESNRERAESQRRRLAGLREKKAEISQAIDSLNQKLLRLAELRKVREKIAEDGRIWRTLEQACGPNGIQALELDALAPSITTVCNRLLSASYGTRFAVEVRTERIAGTGSRTKQVEDFEIIIHDAERETEQPLDTLSGGESVWIKKALYDAFGIIRAQNTGLQFDTVVLDEADGALDSEARASYVRMIEAAHTESGRAHTIIITHSLEAQDMIGQRIDMSAIGEERAG